jgi:hypothetical protein
VHLGLLDLLGLVGLHIQNILFVSFLWIAIQVSITFASVRVVPPRENSHLLTNQSVYYSSEDAFQVENLNVHHAHEGRGAEGKVRLGAHENSEDTLNIDKDVHTTGAKDRKGKHGRSSSFEDSRRHTEILKHYKARRRRRSSSQTSSSNFEEDYWEVSNGELKWKP